MTKLLIRSKEWTIKSLLFVSLLMIFTSCQRQETVVNSIAEREANEIIVFLAGKDINAKKIRSVEGSGSGGSSNAAVLWDIQVPHSQTTEAMALLNLAGLPRKKSPSMLQIFQKGGLVSSESEEKIRYQAGLAEQIANTIRKIDGVIDADIQLSFPTKDSFDQTEKAPPSASVYVKHTGILDDPNAHLVTKIKRLVASGINDLSFENVTVISDKARFTDFTFTSLESGGLDDEKEYVRIWSIIISKDSAKHFQILFFSLCTIILLLILVIAALIWKLYPILHANGGIKALLTTQPLTSQKEAKEEAKTSQITKEENVALQDIEDGDDTEEDDEGEDEEEEDDDDDEEEEEE